MMMTSSLLLFLLLLPECFSTAVYNKKFIDDWIQVGSNINGSVAGDRFGASLDLSADGRTMVVGGTGTSNSTGQVRVLEFNDQTNQYLPYFGSSNINGQQMNEMFGRLVSISADGRTIAGIGDDNVVRVYKINESIRQYQQFGWDIVPENQNNYYSDMKMSADSTTIVMGGNSRVSIYQMYNASSSSSSNITNGYYKITTDILGGNIFAIPVAISADGTTITVNADDYVGFDFCSGTVRSYQFNPTTLQYTPTGFKISSDGQEGSVAMSSDGRTIVIGDYCNGGCQQCYTGRVRVYKLDPSTNQFQKIGSDINGDELGEVFGSELTISADGTTFAVMTRSESVRVRIFRFNMNTGQYQQLGTEIIDVDCFAMSADGTTIAVGEPWRGESGDLPGHVRVYKFGAKSRKCGLLRLGIFCLGPGECGFFRRLFNINGC